MVGEDKKYLALCQSLQEHLSPLPLRPGAIVARGYADVGFEEWLVLANRSLSSILTGKTLEIAESELLQHYFCVPDLQELTHLLSMHGLSIRSVDYRDQREWVVVVESLESGVTYSSTKSCLKFALLSVIAELFGRVAEATPALRVVSGSKIQ